MVLDMKITYWEYKTREDMDNVLMPDLEGMQYTNLGHKGRFTVSPKVNLEHKLLIYDVSNGSETVSHSIRFNTENQVIDAFNAMTVGDISDALRHVLRSKPNF